MAYIFMKGFNRLCQYLGCQKKEYAAHYCREHYGVAMRQVRRKEIFSGDTDAD